MSHVTASWGWRVSYDMFQRLEFGERGETVSDGITSWDWGKRGKVSHVTTSWVLEKELKQRYALPCIVLLCPASFCLAMHCYDLQC